jgi:hypothetical protein
MAEDKIENIPHKEIDVDFPLGPQTKRSQWGNSAYVYCPPSEYNFFAICSVPNEGLKGESAEAFTVPVYEKGNDGQAHVGLPYSFAKEKLYATKNPIMQVLEQGNMLAVVVYFNAPQVSLPPEVKSDATKR